MEIGPITITIPSWIVGIITGLLLAKAILNAVKIYYKIKIQKLREK